MKENRKLRGRGSDFRKYTSSRKKNGLNNKVNFKMSFIKKKNLLIHFPVPLKSSVFDFGPEFSLDDETVTLFLIWNSIDDLKTEVYNQS